MMVSGAANSLTAPCIIVINGTAQLFSMRKRGGTWTSIRIRKTTVERLKEVGRKGETYDDIINRLIDAYLERR